MSDERALYVEITGKNAEGRLRHWTLYKRLDELADGVDFPIDAPDGWRPYEVRLRVMQP